MKRPRKGMNRVLRGLLAVELLLLGSFGVYRALHPVHDGIQRESSRWRSATLLESKGAARSIKAQLDDFRKGDYRSAITWQSQSLKEIFPSIGQFRHMMITQYPQFAQYKSVEFGPAVADEYGDHVRASIRLTGQDGVKVSAVYEMVLEEGAYRIRGVALGESRPEPLSGISS